MYEVHRVYTDTAALITVLIYKKPIIINYLKLLFSNQRQKYFTSKSKIII